MKKNKLANGAKEKSNVSYLEFEKPLAALDKQIIELRNLQKDRQDTDFGPEIRKLEANLVALTSKIYQNLSPWETVQVARHPNRPLLTDYLEMIVKDFCELHGDRFFGDDKAIVSGFGHIGREKVMVIGHNKGRDTKEKVACNFGCAHPEGYRKAMKKMKLAEKFGLPVVCFIDTPGAYPGIGAEERGQAEAIAYNLMEMSRLRTPIICVVIGEGGSGGALGIGVGDRYAMLQYAWYTVASPEACAAILFKDGTRAPEAAEALNLTSKCMTKLGIIDDTVSEPFGGAHRNPHEAAHNLELYITRTIRQLKRMDIDTLLNNRYQRLSQMGEYQYVTPDQKTAGVSPHVDIVTPAALRGNKVTN